MEDTFSSKSQNKKYMRKFARLSGLNSHDSRKIEKMIRTEADKERKSNRKRCRFLNNDYHSCDVYDATADTIEQEYEQDQAFDLLQKLMQKQELEEYKLYQQEQFKQYQQEQFRQYLQQQREEQRQSESHMTLREIFEQWGISKIMSTGIKGDGWYIGIALVNEFAKIGYTQLPKVSSPPVRVYDMLNPIVTCTIGKVVAQHLASTDRFVRV